MGPTEPTNNTLAAGSRSETRLLTAAVEPFRRDRPTWLCYGALGAYSFWLYAFGPAVALLRGELHFSYALVGVYSALWAGGATAAGGSFVYAVRALGRRRLLWAAAVATTVGAALFTTSKVVALTLLGALVMGLAGTTVLTLTQAVLAERHGPRTSQALTEANIGAGAGAVVAPLALGALAATPGGWRPALALPAVIFAALYLSYRREQLPQTLPSRGEGSPRRLPAACWLLACLVAACIAVEFCVVYFGTELLATTGLAPATAAAAMSAFYLGILAGRVGGARLSRRPGRSTALVSASLASTTAGFVVFWLSGHPVPAVAGLFICGVGVANLYPLSLALALAAAPGRTDAANALTQLLGGAVVIAAPLLLGTLADQVGLVPAFAVEPLLVVLSGLLLVGGTRLHGGRQRAGPA